MKIYHNNRCRKSRETLELIKEKGQTVEIIEYLKTPPKLEELKDLVQKLKMRPEELVRKSEELFKEKYSGKKFTDQEWIEIMAENPILIERPIVVHGEKAIIGRPPERVLDLL